MICVACFTRHSLISFTAKLSSPGFATLLSHRLLWLQALVPRNSKLGLPTFPLCDAATEGNNEFGLNRRVSLS